MFITNFIFICFLKSNFEKQAKKNYNLCQEHGETKNAKNLLEFDIIRCQNVSSLSSDTEIQFVKHLTLPCVSTDWC